MSDKQEREPGQNEVGESAENDTARDSTDRAAPKAPGRSLDAIKARLGELKVAISKKVESGAPVAGAAPPPLPSSGSTVPPASDATAPKTAREASPTSRASTTPATAPTTPPTRSAATRGDTGEAVDGPRTDPGFDIPFHLRPGATGSQASAATWPAGGAAATAQGATEPATRGEGRRAETVRPVRRQWLTLLLATLPVTGFLCLLSYYLGNARLRSDRVQEGRATVAFVRQTVDSANASATALATRIRRAYAETYDPRSLRFTRIPWADWEALRATERPKDLDNLLGARRYDRLGNTAVGLLFSYYVKMVELYRATAEAANAALARRADLDRASTDPVSPSAKGEYAVVVHPPTGDPPAGKQPLVPGEVVLVKRRRAPNPKVKGDSGGFDVSRLSAANEQQIVAVGQDDIIAIAQRDLIRSGNDLLRDYADRFARLLALVNEIDAVRPQLQQEIERLSR